MSVGSIAETAGQLIAHGLDVETHYALIENGTTDQQRVLRGTLATIAHDARKARIHAPAIIIVGATAGLGKELEWFASAPESSGLDSNQNAPWHRDVPILYDSTSA
jgi:siroheme synthase